MESYRDLVSVPVPASPGALSDDQALIEERRLTLDERRQNRILGVLRQTFEFVRVLGVGEMGRIYYRPRPDGTSRDEVFRPFTRLDGMRVVQQLYKQLYGTATARRVEGTYDTLCLDVDDETNGLEGRYIKVGHDAYWDTEEARLQYTAGGRCMRRLFDSHPKDELHVDIESVTVLKRVVSHVEKYLEEHDGNVDTSVKDDWLDVESPWLNPLWVWANYDCDTFNDLLKATAANFMAHKPKGAFILIGRTRNGKSSYIKMLHTLFGRNNTSAVKLADLQDSHQNMTLLTSMMNAPDEEDEGKGKELLQSQSFFKSIAAHEPILLNVMYSQEPQLVSTDFMSYFPMNKLPEWTGSATEALMRRSLILMFNNDLSQFDNSGRNFEKETYTASFYSGLVPVLLGVAAYYKNRPMTFSKTLQRNQRTVAEELDSVSTYLGLFFKYFGGYEKPNTVFEDYKLWCIELGLHYESSSVVREKLKIYGEQKRTKKRMGSQAVNYTQVLAKKNLPPFLRQSYVPGTSLTVDQTICDWTDSHGAHHIAQSVVGILEGQNREADPDEPEKQVDIEDLQEVLDL